MSRLLSLTILLFSIAATSSEHTKTSDLVPETNLVTALQDSTETHSSSIATRSSRSDTQDAILTEESSRSDEDRGSGEPTEEEVSQVEADIEQHTNETASAIAQEDYANGQAVTETITEDLEANGSGYAKEAEQDVDDEAETAKADVDENGSGAIIQKAEEVEKEAKSEYEDAKSEAESYTILTEESSRTNDGTDGGSGEPTEEEASQAEADVEANVDKEDVENEYETAKTDVDENGSGAIIQKADEIEGTDGGSGEPTEEEASQAEADVEANVDKEDVENEYETAKADVDENGSGAIIQKADESEGRESKYEDN